MRRTSAFILRNGHFFHNAGDAAPIPRPLSTSILWDQYWQPKKIEANIQNRAASKLKVMVMLITMLGRCCHPSKKPARRRNGRHIA